MESHVDSCAEEKKNPNRLCFGHSSDKYKYLLMCVCGINVGIVVIFFLTFYGYIGRDNDF